MSVPTPYGSYVDMASFLYFFKCIKPKDSLGNYMNFNLRCLWMNIPVFQHSYICTQAPAWMD